MPEFIPVLIAGFIILAVMYAYVNGDFAAVDLKSVFATGPAAAKVAPRIVSPTNLDSNPTGMTVSMPNLKALELDSNRVIGGQAVELTQFNGTTKAGLIETDKNTFSFKGSRFDRGFLYFYVNNTNNYGQLTFDLNGNEIYRDYPVENQFYRIEFDGALLRSANNLTVRAGGPNWMFWAENKYEYGGRIVGNYGNAKSYNFTLDSSKNVKIMIDANEIWGDMTVKLNGETVYYGHDYFIRVDLPDGKAKRENTLEIIPNPNAKIIIDYLDIFYE